MAHTCTDMTETLDNFYSCFWIFPEIRLTPLILKSAIRRVFHKFSYFRKNMIFYLIIFLTVIQTTNGKNLNETFHANDMSTDDDGDFWLKESLEDRAFYLPLENPPINLTEIL